MRKDEPLLSNCPLETAEPSRNYARIPGYKKKYKKKTKKRREKKRKTNGVEINTRAYAATRLLLRWDYLYAVTLKTKVFGDYNHARLEVSWITSTRGLLLRGYTGRGRGPGQTKVEVFVHLLVFKFWFQSGWSFSISEGTLFEGSLWKPVSVSFKITR